jgi:thiol-disulfide isomerase/thioredoxin
VHGDRPHVCVVLLGKIFKVAYVVIVACLGTFAANATVTPSVNAVDLTGKQVDPLHADPGKAVVLIFIRTDCPVSNRYAPTIQRLSAEYSEKVAFWLVYPDKEESSATIQRHLQDYKYKLPALRDPQYSLVKLSKAQVTPEAAVFDAGGQLVYHGRIDNWYQDFGHARAGPTTHELDDALQAVVQGKKPQVTTAAGIGCYISDIE